MARMNKQEAAEYLKITVAKLNYHRYQTGLFPPGKRNKFGVLEWTPGELDRFARLDIKPGYRDKPGRKTITPPRFAELAVRPGVKVYYNNRRVLKVERGFNHTREWWLTLEGVKDITPVWNNVRLTVREGK